jgi:flagellin
VIASEQVGRFARTRQPDWQKTTRPRDPAMPLNVVSNHAANVAHRNLVQTDKQATASLSKLSIGQRVVSARDDAASMAVGSRMRAEVQALKQAVVNAGQANSMLQIADGAMSTVSEILIRMWTPRKTLVDEGGM